jgi:O-antigen/teichoic acid export membrane protein
MNEAPASPGAAGETPRHHTGGDPIGRQIARNSILSLAGRLTQVAGWVVVAPYMLHHLGAERFGLWSLLTVISGLYMTFDLGVGSALTKFVAEYRAIGDRAGLRSVFSMGAILYVALGLVIIGVFAIAGDRLLDLFKVAPALRPEAGRALLAAAAVYALLNLYMLTASVLTGLHRMDVWNRISIGVTLTQLAGVLLVLRMGGGLVALMMNTGVTLALGTILGRIAIRRLAPEIGFDRSAFKPGLFRRLTRYSAALQVINLGVLVQFQLDKVLFGALVSLAAVANFEFGLRVVTALWSLPSLLLPPLLPAAAHLDAAGDRERVRRLYRRASRYVLAVAFPVAAGVIAVAPALYRAWLGPGHEDAARAATALAAMLGINILTGVGTSLVRGLGRPGLEVRYQIIAIVLHVGLSLVLIPRFGFTGGLWALVISTSIGSLYFVWVFHRFLDEPLGAFIRDVIGPPLVAAAIGATLGAVASGAIGSGLHDANRTEALLRLGLGAGLMAGATLGVLLLTRFLSMAELRELLGLIRGRGTTPTAALESSG